MTATVRIGADRLAMVPGVIRLASGVAIGVLGAACAGTRARRAVRSAA